jgi:hypothetical protein
MEDGLAGYKRPYDPVRPVVSLDETCLQVLGEVRLPSPTEPGRPALYDPEHVWARAHDVTASVATMSRAIRRLGITVKKRSDRHRTGPGPPRRLAGGAGRG